MALREKTDLYLKSKSHINYTSSITNEMAVNYGIFFETKFAISKVFSILLKHNAYNKTISFWQAMKLTAWTMISPAILGLGLGFLIKSFATAIFPLLLGIRAMWLTMKSFKPDGTGYVESND